MAVVKAMLASLIFGVAWTMTSARVLYNETDECPYIPGKQDFSVRRVGIDIYVWAQRSVFKP